MIHNAIGFQRTVRYRRTLRYSVSVRMLSASRSYHDHAQTIVASYSHLTEQTKEMY